MNSKQRRSIWREHQAKIESLEFQYRVLSGQKPDRNVTRSVPKYLELLQRAVAARRQLKSETGSSKGWCNDDPISNLWVNSANGFAGNQWTIQQQARMRRGKSWVSGLRANTIIIDEITNWNAIQHGQIDDQVQSALNSKAAVHARTLGASAGPSDTSSGSTHQALSRQADDQVDALVHLFRGHLGRYSPTI